LPVLGRLLLLWERAGPSERLRLLVAGLLDRLEPGGERPAAVQGPRELDELRALRDQLAGLSDGRALSAEALESDFVRILSRLQARDANVRLVLIPPAARAGVVRLLAAYEQALAALYERPENDVYEGVLNRVAVLEAVRDVGWLLSERR